MAFDVQTYPVTICVSVALVLIYALQTIKSYRKGKLPPGPKGIPFLGNLFQLSSMPWKEYEVWKKQYGTSTHPSVVLDADFVLNAGPLVYLRVGRQGILVLNTHQVSADLLDHRGHIYSDRPRMISKCGCCHRPLSHISLLYDLQCRTRYSAVGCSWVRSSPAKCASSSILLGLTR